MEIKKLDGPGLDARTARLLLVFGDDRDKKGQNILEFSLDSLLGRTLLKGYAFDDYLVRGTVHTGSQQKTATTVALRKPEYEQLKEWLRVEYPDQAAHLESLDQCPNRFIKVDGLDAEARAGPRDVAIFIGARQPQYQFTRRTDGLDEAIKLLKKLPAETTTEELVKVFEFVRPIGA